jgi:hypothetical protein
MSMAAGRYDPGMTEPGGPALSLVVSASRYMVAGLWGLFDVEVDGVEADRQGRAGKPDPALFLEGAVAGRGGP